MSQLLAYSYPGNTFPEPLRETSLSLFQIHSWNTFSTVEFSLSSTEPSTANRRDAQEVRKLILFPHDLESQTSSYCTEKFSPTTSAEMHGQLVI
jgi:hypothetical protein